MTVNEAIQALTEARDKIGGDALLLMVDDLHVVRLPINEEYRCVYVEDEPQPDDPDEVKSEKAIREER